MPRAEGSVVSIAIRTRSGAAMQERNEAEIRIESGVAEDFRGKPGKRQVTVLSKDAWDAACAEVDVTLPWTERRANLLLTGLELLPTPGARLRVGTALLEVTGQTDPCVRMDAATPGLFAALERHNRAGVCCRVVESGHAKAGDSASWEDT